MNIGDQAERSAQEEELRSQQRRMELAQALQAQMQPQQQGFAQNSGGLGVLGMAAQGLAGSEFGKDLKGLFAGGGLV